MRTNINIDSFGNFWVELSGHTDYENAIPFRDGLLSLLKTNPRSLITLDLHHLDFVGSSGINLFVESLKMGNALGNRLRLAHVKSEFQKVFKLYQLEMTIVDSQMENVEATDEETQRLERFNKLKRQYTKEL